MEYVTACYRQKEEQPEIFLTLQQRVYRRTNTRVLCAGISDCREQLIGMQKFMEAEIDAADMRSIRKNHADENVRDRCMEYLAEQREDISFAGILCIDDRVILLDRGRIQICFFFHRFGRTKWKPVTESCMIGRVEPDTAILLANHAFLNFTEERLADCLGPGNMRESTLSPKAESADRRLLELGKMAEVQGGIHMGAIWILPVRGERYGV